MRRSVIGLFGLLCCVLLPTGSRVVSEAWAVERVSPTYSVKAVQKLLQTMGARPNRKKRQRLFAQLKTMPSLSTIQALLWLCRQRKTKRLIRGNALWALGVLQAHWTIPWIRRYRFSRSRFLRYRARKALRLLCPRRLRNKAFYLNVDTVDVKGPLSDYLSHTFAKKLHQIIRKNKEVSALWYRCRLPSRRALRRRRVQGFRIRFRLKVSQTAAGTNLLLKSMWTTFPGNAIRQWREMTVDVNSPPTPLVFLTALPTMMRSLSLDIRTFLESKRRYKRRRNRRRKSRLRKKRRKRKGRRRHRRKR